MEKSREESSAIVIASADARAAGSVASGRQATAAPPGLGPGVEWTTTARDLTLRTSPRSVQVSMSADRPRPHIGQMTAQVIAASIAALGPELRSASRRQCGRPASNAGSPSAAISASRGPSTIATDARACG